VEKAYQGNMDHVRAALDLFVDFAAIFVSTFFHMEHRPCLA
jgi:hypothetical protein